MGILNNFKPSIYLGETISNTDNIFIGASSLFTIMDYFINSKNEVTLDPKKKMDTLSAKERFVQSIEKLFNDERALTLTIIGKVIKTRFDEFKETLSLQRPEEDRTIFKIDCTA